MKRTMQRYNLVRIRAKISYTAFIMSQTIPELICNGIINSHRLLVKEGEIPERDQNKIKKEEIFQNILSGDVSSFFSEAIKINLLNADSNTVDHALFLSHQIRESA